jgi:hypothetical protein
LQPVTTAAFTRGPHAGALPVWIRMLRRLLQARFDHVERLAYTQKHALRNARARAYVRISPDQPRPHTPNHYARSHAEGMRARAHAGPAVLHWQGRQRQIPHRSVQPPSCWISQAFPIRSGELGRARMPNTPGRCAGRRGSKREKERSRRRPPRGPSNAELLGTKTTRPGGGQPSKLSWLKWAQTYCLVEQEFRCGCRLRLHAASAWLRPQC